MSRKNFHLWPESFPPWCNPTLAGFLIVIGVAILPFSDARFSGEALISLGCILVGLIMAALALIYRGFR